MRVFTLRGEILDYLRFIGNKSVDELNITHIFYMDYLHLDIKDSLFYLSDKGYISKNEVDVFGHAYKKKNIYKLTAKGIDLLDGLIKDSGIVVPNEKN